MSNNLDFEFGFGSGRYLKGRGWSGILALALLLCALVNALWARPPAVGSAARLISLLRH